MISDNFKKVILLYVYYMGRIDLRYRVYLLCFLHQIRCEKYSRSTLMDKSIHLLGMKILFKANWNETTYIRQTNDGPEMKAPFCRPKLSLKMRKVAFSNRHVHPVT